MSKAANAPALLRMNLEPIGRQGDIGKLKADPTTSALVLERAGHTAYVHAPSSDGPLPVLIVLHGAGKGKMWNLKEQVERWAARAQAYNMLVLYPEARASTWDYIKSGGRADVDFIQFALNSVRSAFQVDERRIAVIGISDGGSMALSMGVHNPSIFQAVMSVSAGFCAAPPIVTGKAGGPKMFMMHGSEDGMFPLKRVGLPLRDKLSQAGYVVEFCVGKGEGHVPAGWQEAFLPSWLGMGTSGRMQLTQ